MITFDETHREAMGEKLTKRIAQALTDGDLTLEQLPDVASLILDTIDRITTHMELVTFLTTLTKDYSFFEDLLTLERGEEQEEEAHEKVDKVQQLIEQNRLDEAIKAAQQASQT